MLTSNGYRLDESARRLGRLRPVPAGDREDRAALWARLRRDGHLYLPGLLDREQVLAFRRYYFESLADVGLLDQAAPAGDGRDGGGPVRLQALREVLFSEVVPGKRYEDFCAQPAIRGWFEWFYDSPTFLHRRKIIRHVRPGESGVGTATQAHYDLVYLREGTDRLLSMWIPLGDIPVERGPLIYLEGSHRTYTDAERRGSRLPAASMSADLPALAEQHDTRWLVTDFAAGDVMVHSPFMVHASLDNVDPQRQLRLSTDIRYQRARDAIDWRWQQHWREDDGL